MLVSFGSASEGKTLMVQAQKLHNPETDWRSKGGQWLVFKKLNLNISLNGVSDKIFGSLISSISSYIFDLEINKATLPGNITDFSDITPITRTNVGNVHFCKQLIR